LHRLTPPAPLSASGEGGREKKRRKRERVCKVINNNENKKNQYFDINLLMAITK